MSQSDQSYEQVDATPVGASGTGVQIHEHEAWTINGWYGVLAIAVCIGVTILLARGSTKGFISIPIVVAVVIIGSLVIGAARARRGWCSSSAVTSARCTRPAFPGSVPRPSTATSASESGTSKRTTSR